MDKAVIFFINLYQKLLSPDHSWRQASYPGGYCRYHPTCSEYAKLSIQEHGLAKGLFLGGARLLRCHPWAPSGADPIIRRQAN